MTKLEVGKEYWVKGEVKARTSRGIYAVIEFGNDEQIIWVSDNETSSIEAVEAIPEREKVTLPKVAGDWLDVCKANGDSLLSAMNTGINYEPSNVSEWLSYRDNQEKFALAWRYGYEVEEPLGVLLVDIPRGGFWKYNFLYRDKSGEFTVNGAGNTNVLVRHAYKVTEAEAKEKYPNFKWVSLEELGDETIRNL